MTRPSTHRDDASPISSNYFPPAAGGLPGWCQPQPALAEVLTAAEAVLAAMGNAVALCPVHGTGACGGEPS